MDEGPLTAEKTLAMLRENASRLAELDGLPPERLLAAPQPDEWSANEVLAHIRACCDVWGENMARILTADHPTFPGRNPRTWMKQTDYPEWPFEKALRTFSAQREELLGTLAALTPDEWELSATVTSYGRASERTLRSYAAGARRAAAHERRFAEPALWSAGAPLATRVPADRAKSAAKSIEWRYEGT